jgi:hypothetical protein
MGISVKRGGGQDCQGGSRTKGIGGLDDGRVSRGRATPELLPLDKVMRASSGNLCKRRCMHHLDKREGTGWSRRQEHSRQR